MCPKAKIQKLDVSQTYTLKNSFLSAALISTDSLWNTGDVMAAGAFQTAPPGKIQLEFLHCFQ